MTDREKEILQSYLNNEKDVLNQIKQNYEDSIATINSKIAELMGRQDADMQHVVYQIEFQKALKEQNEVILKQLQDQNFETVSEYLTKCYEDGYIGAMYNIQGQGIPLIIPIDQEQVVQAIKTKSKLSKSLYDSFDMKDLKKKISTEISRGMSSNMTFQEIARNISNRAGIAENNAIRIARTEGGRIQNTAAFHACEKAKAYGCDVVKQWLSVLDGKTRHNHRVLDGQIKEVEEPFEVDGYSPMFPMDFGVPSEDCNCRCALMERAKWALDESELATLEERAEYFDLDKSEDFADYKKKYLKATESERVRSNTQMINDGLSKAVSVPKDCKYVLKTENNFEGKDVDENAIRSIDSTIEKLKSEGHKFNFDSIQVAKFSGNDASSVFITDYDSRGKTRLYLNKDYFEGKTVDSVNSMCESLNESNWWKSKNVDDLIKHESMHAQINHYNSFEKAEALYEELNDDKRVKGLCGLVDKYPSEFMNEMFVALENGENIDGKYISVYNEYAEKFLKE